MFGASPKLVFRSVIAFCLAGMAYAAVDVWISVTFVFFTHFVELNKS